MQDGENGGVICYQSTQVVDYFLFYSGSLAHAGTYLGSGVKTFVYFPPTSISSFSVHKDKSNGFPEPTLFLLSHK